MNRRLLALPSWPFTALGIVLAAGLVFVAAGILPKPSWLSLPLVDRDGDARTIADRAEATVRKASETILAAKRQDGVVATEDVANDPSGLLGAEMTPLVTTLGNLEAKRLSTSPAWARVLTKQLHDAGVGRESVVAASFSGSFPALNLAVVAACDALGARLIAASSVTASMWGASEPGYTWPELEARLVSSRIIKAASIAVSMGGEGDRARDLQPEGRGLAEAIARRSAEALHATLLLPANDEDAVTLRMHALLQAAGSQQIAVYVNVGGSQASMGQSPAVLKMQSGWIVPGAFSSSPSDGVMALMSRRGVPVLHLLNITELALRWGIS